MLRIIFILLLAALSASAADPVPANRLPPEGTWRNRVGVSNGIPAYTVVADTIAPYTGTAGTINAAIDAAGDDEVVLLSAGTFNISSQIQIDQSRVVLRGETNANGVPTTIINFTASSDACIIISGGSWDLNDSGQFTRRNVSSGATRGSTQITLASAPTGLSVNQMLWISNPSPTPDAGVEALYGTDGYTQIVRVTAINGAVVDFTPAFNADYLAGTTQVGYRGGTIRRTGAEHLSLTRSGGGAHYLRANGTNECWWLNVKALDVPNNGYHFYCYGNYRFEVRHCDFSRMTTLGSSTYCIFGKLSTDVLIIDNYFHEAPNIMTLVGMTGMAFAYNYIHDLPYSLNNEHVISQIVFSHGGHNCYNLIEGSWLTQSYHDVGGSSTNMTYFRNRMRAWDESPTQGEEKTANCNAIVICRGHTGYTMAGNILGENGSGKHDTLTNYWTGTVDMPGSSWNIFCVESQSFPSFIRTNNYNTVTDSVPSDEALTGGQTLVDSYLFSSRPSFAHYWPLVEPSNPSRAGVSGDSAAVDNLAAAYRAANSGADPNWGVPTGTPSRRQALRGIRLKI